MYIQIKNTREYLMAAKYVIITYNPQRHRIEYGTD